LRGSVPWRASIVFDMPDAQGRMETFLTLILRDSDPALAEAHDELYPERIPEQIPLSLTLLYPWIPRDALTEADIEGLREFFADRAPPRFDLARLAEFPEAVVYAVPEPEQELRAILRALWARYPDYPPYGEPGGDPPPHATLGRLLGDYAITLEAARERVGPLLPVTCDVREATLMEEVEPDRYQPLAALTFGG
jgi:2'-5' RNA ligase superfamily